MPKSFAISVVDRFRLKRSRSINAMKLLCISFRVNISTTFLKIVPIIAGKW